MVRYFHSLIPLEVKLVSSFSQQLASQKAIVVWVTKLTKDHYENFAILSLHRVP